MSKNQRLIDISKTEDVQNAQERFFDQRAVGVS